MNAAGLFAVAAGECWVRLSGGFASRWRAVIPRVAPLRLGPPLAHDAALSGLKKSEKVGRKSTKRRLN